MSYVVIVEADDPDRFGWTRAVTGPYRTVDKAKTVADRFQRAMDKTEHEGTWYAHIELCEKAPAVMSQIRTMVTMNEEGND